MGEELKISADVANLDQVLEFVETRLEAHDASMKSITQISIAVEEIYVNIAHYAYGDSTGDATIQVSFDDRVFVITFIDTGMPYDPLAKPDPDITLSVEEREIGGLGIYMVKKSMDDVIYKRDGNKNVLTLRKSID